MGQLVNSAFCNGSLADVKQIIVSYTDREKGRDKCPNEITFRSKAIKYSLVYGKFTFRSIWQ